MLLLFDTFKNKRDTKNAVCFAPNLSGRKSKIGTDVVVVLIL